MSILLPPNSHNLQNPNQSTCWNWEFMLGLWLRNYQSKATRESYKATVQRFCYDMQIHPSEATEAHVAAWLVKNAEWSDDTSNQRLSALSSFYSFVLERVNNLHPDERITANPTQGIKRRKTTPYGKANKAEASEGLEALRMCKRDTLKGKRDFAVLFLFLTLGFRAMGVYATLRKDYAPPTLSIKNKGGNIRTFRLNDVQVEAINQYLAARTEEQGAIKPEHGLFVATVNWKRKATKPLSRTAVWNIVKTYLPHRSPHSLRHAAAILALDNNATLLEVQALLGHSSIKTTEIYARTMRGDAGVAKVTDANTGFFAEGLK